LCVYIDEIMKYIGFKIYVLLILAALAVSFGTPRAQTVYSLDDYPGKKIFEIDYSQFKGEDENLNRLEIYYKIYTSGLQFVRENDQYRADYEITGAIYDKDKRQVTAFDIEKSIRVNTYNATMSPSDFRISQINRYLPPGKYKVEFHLIDKNSGNDIKSSLKAELIRYDNRNPQLSGIQLVHAVDTAIIDTVFRKGNLTVIPAVSRQLSGDLETRLLYYIEVYRGTDKLKKILIETRLLDKKLRTVYLDTLTSSFGGEDNIIREVRHITLNNLRSGEYYIDIVLKSRRGKGVDRARLKFYLYWSPEAMITNDYETAIEQLKYIAESDDMKALKKAENAEERIARWNDFWASKDPSPGTAENEIKAAYYGRIDFANRNFTVMKKAGWRSDRGMIYIEYGEPDQVEDYPFELNSKAYQIWYYYRYGDPRKFVFVDEWGDNDFKLLYPYDGRVW